MSFSELKVGDLKQVAETFGVDAKSIKSKQELIALLDEEGISYDMYAKLAKIEKVDIEIPENEKKRREKMKSIKPDNSVLVKMERMNHSFQTQGYTFSQEHPFVAMPEDDAQRIFDTQEGFRLATPREAQEFYA
jgi:alanyl-tRNA synthetase